MMGIGNWLGIGGETRCLVEKDLSQSKIDKFGGLGQLVYDSNGQYLV